jgi:UDP-N-acetylglucosamine transferase subunit ALG13
MILVTVGTDLPFDRMVRVIDAWACEKRRQDVFAQIGDGGWEPAYIPFAHFLPPLKFNELFTTARVIISHAGMGTILSALHHGKPILVMPKLASLGEHRNEHQLATARQMREFGNVNVALDEHELRRQLDQLDCLLQPKRIGASASPELLDGLRGFISGGAVCQQLHGIS